MLSLEGLIQAPTRAAYLESFSQAARKFSPVETRILCDQAIFSPSTFLHIADVITLSMILGLDSVSASLHDVGKSLLAQEHRKWQPSDSYNALFIEQVTNRPLAQSNTSVLTREEKSIIDTHSSLSFYASCALLEEIPIPKREAHTTAAAIRYHHRPSFSNQKLVFADLTAALSRWRKEYQVKPIPKETVLYQSARHIAAGNESKWIQRMQPFVYYAHALLQHTVEAGELVDRMLAAQDISEENRRNYRDFQILPGIAQNILDNDQIRTQIHNEVNNSLAYIQ